MKKKWIVVAVVIVIIFVFFFSLPYLVWLPFQLAYESPPKPKIKYGEFPFEITYEIDGEVKTVKDVLVCKYDGIGINEAKKFRKWKNYLKSNKKAKSVFLTQDEKRVIYLFVGDASYYMNDFQVKTNQALPPYIYWEKLTNDYEAVSEEEIMKQYKIKILNYKLSEPIENSFE